MVDSNKLTSRNYFKALSILNLALVSGVVLIGLLISILILTTNASDNSTEFSGIFNYMVPAFVVIGIIGGNNLFKKTLNQSGENLDLDLDLNLSSKMTNYRSALIMKYALLEGPALFAIIAAFVSHQIGLMAYAGVLVFLLLYSRPNVKSTITALKLDQQESSIIEDPEGVISEMPETLK